MENVIAIELAVLFGLLSLGFSGRGLERAAAVLLVLMVAAAGILPGTRVVVMVHACNGCGFLLTWGSSGSGNSQFHTPIGVAVDGSGNVYVVDSGNNRVEKFTSTGTFITAWGSTGSGNGQFHSPYDVAVDSGGNVYVADVANSRVDKFSIAGVFVGWAGGCTSGSNCVSGTSNGFMCTLATCGAPVSGSGNGQFNGPYGVAVDSSGYVYVADSDNNRVEKFDSSGNYITLWNSFAPYPPPSKGSFNSPAGVAVDASGNVYVADSGNNLVEKFTGSGGLLAVWGGSGSGPGKFNMPENVAVDSSGNVYVSDYGNNRVEKFDSSGDFLATWGSHGSGLGQFGRPGGVGVDSLGNVYVADTDNNHVELFGDSPPLGSGATLVSLSLPLGWNLVSLPIVPFSNSISSVLAGLIAAGNLSIVWSYRTVCTSGKLGLLCSQSWLFYQPTSASPTLTTMADGFGYWVYVTQPSRLTVLGYVVPPEGVPSTYSLVAGWNLLGFKPQPTVGNETVGFYLGSISGKYTTVGIYDNLNQTWVDGAPGYPLSPGQAMWVYMTAAATLVPSI